MFRESYIANSAVKLDQIKKTESGKEVKQSLVCNSLRTRAGWECGWATEDNPCFNACLRCYGEASRNRKAHREGRVKALENNALETSSQDQNGVYQGQSLKGGQKGLTVSAPQVFTISKYQWLLWEALSHPLSTGVMITVVLCLSCPVLEI